MGYMFMLLKVPQWQR